MDIKRAIALPLTVAAVVLSSAVPATAVTTGDYKGTNVNIRSCQFTTSNCSIVGTGDKGDKAWVFCWVSGTTVSGQWAWDKNQNKQTGKAGFSSNYYMTYTPPLYPC